MHHYTVNSGKPFYQELAPREGKTRQVHRLIWWTRAQRLVEGKGSCGALMRFTILLTQDQGDCGTLMWFTFSNIEIRNFVVSGLRNQACYNLVEISILTRVSGRFCWPFWVLLELTKTLLGSWEILAELVTSMVIHSWQLQGFSYILYSILLSQISEPLLAIFSIK